MKRLPVLNKESQPWSLRNYRLSLLATCSVIVAFSFSQLSANVKTWTGGSGAGDWNDNGNWIPSHPVLSGNALTFGSTIGLLNNNKTNVQSLSLAMTLTGAIPVPTATSGQTVIMGAMSGAGGLSISGGGTLSLNNTNSYTGATTLATGTTIGCNLTANSCVTRVGDLTIGSGDILDVGLGGATDRTLAISGSVTATGTMRFRVGGVAVADRDALTVGSFILSGTTLDLIFTDGAVTVMSDATQAIPFLDNPTNYASSAVYQIISSTTSGNVGVYATMDSFVSGTLGVAGPEQAIISVGQLLR